MLWTPLSKKDETFSKHLEQHQREFFYFFQDSPLYLCDFDSVALLTPKKTYSQPRFLRTGYLGFIFSWFSYVFFHQDLAFHRNSVGVPTKKPIGLSLLFDIWVFLKKT